MIHVHFYLGSLVEGIPPLIRVSVSESICKFAHSIFDLSDLDLTGSDLPEKPASNPT